MSYQTIGAAWEEYAAGARVCGSPIHPAEEPAYFAGAVAVIAILAGVSCCKEHMQARLETLVREVERKSAEATASSPRQGVLWDGRQ